MNTRLDMVGFFDKITVPDVTNYRWVADFMNSCTTYGRR